MSEELPKIEITKSPRFGRDVRVGDRYSNNLDSGEMLSTICHLTIRGEIKAIDAPYGGLLNDDEHKAKLRAYGLTDEQIAEREADGCL